MYLFKFFTQIGWGDWRLVLPSPSQKKIKKNFYITKNFRKNKILEKFLC